MPRPARPKTNTDHLLTALVALESTAAALRAVNLRSTPAPLRTAVQEARRDTDVVLDTVRAAIEADAVTTTRATARQLHAV